MKFKLGEKVISEFGVAGEVLDTMPDGHVEIRLDDGSSVVLSEKDLEKDISNTLNVSPGENIMFRDGNRQLPGRVIAKGAEGELIVKRKDAEYTVMPWDVVKKIEMPKTAAEPVIKNELDISFINVLHDGVIAIETDELADKLEIPNELASWIQSNLEQVSYSNEKGLLWAEKLYKKRMAKD